MNVYDFDDTVLWGDSTFKFYLYCLTHYPLCVIGSWPRTARAGVGFLGKSVPLKQFKEASFSFLRGLPDGEKVAKRFWVSNKKHIKKWYLDRKREDDVIVSASPEFLLRPICRELNVTLIATRMNPQTGEILGKNCKGAEKVPRFRAMFPTAKVEEFYSDSLSDTPLAMEAEKSFLIKGEKVSPWPK